MAQTNADIIPDLSHLTLEERQIIESVMMRQKQEEERELEIMRRKQDEVHLLEQSIRQRSEQQKKAGVELDATCHICLKTKFADGVGHMCNYCNIRCCARCGGKVTLRSNKVIWVCILCRKKQELLSKTGQWINKGMNSTPQGDAIMRKIEADMIAHSASEKENQPMLTRNNSGLRRQYSQQETTPYRIPSSDSGVDMRHSTARSRDEELRYYRGELEGLMRQQYSNTSSSTSQYRNDSLSSEQSSSALSHKKRDRRSGGPSKPGGMTQSQLIQQGSFSSSEDDVRSTSEGTSCEEHDSEKESKRRKKTVRFDGTHNQNHINHQSSTGKDSGIDTFTSSEDSNSAQHPLSWKPSADGKYMIGHMILRKSGDRYPSASSTLGIKVIGGKLLEDGTRGAIIEKVKKGSPADLEGHLLAGDQVIEWNGRSMRGKSFQDVEDIIAESRQEPQVELIVSRRIQPKYAPTLSKDVYERVRDKPSVLVTSPGSPDIHSGRPGRPVPSHHTDHHPITNSSVGGRIQVKFYLDSGTLRLVVTLMCAASLVPRSNGQPRCPYAKIYLLPDRSEKSKRRTKTLANTNDPKWNQSFFYPGIRRSDLKLRSIEITVWDYTRYGVNDFLGEGSNDDYLDYRSLTPTDHLSPPSTISRLSDSDTSLDNDDNRRIADGAPPPDLDYVSEKRKSRRDISPPDHKRVHPHHAHPHPMSMESVRRVSTGSRGVPQQGRSHSAASASHSPRSRSKSPPHRTTPVSSPKKHRQLPQIPAIKDQALKERVAQDLEERSKYINQKMRQAMYPRSTGGYLSGSSRRHWSGVSDGDLNIYPRRSFSPPPHDSDMDSVVSSAFSTQSERPRGSTHYSDYGHSSASNASSIQHQHHHSDAVKRGTFSRSLSNADVPSDDNGKSVDNTSLRSSDTQLHQTSMEHHGDSRRRGGKSSSGIKHSNSGTSDKSGNSSDRGERSDRERERGERSSNLGKKSSSTSQLSATGRRRRLGFGAKGKSSFTVHRSEEILPGGLPATSKPLVKQASSVSSDGDNTAADAESWTPTLKGSDSGQLSEFIEGLGPGQVVGRQVLGLPSKGEVQLSLNNVKGCLVVEVIRAKNLQPKPDSKTLPAPYVKLYLVTGKKCIAKAKTPIARRTLEPLYQKSLTFREPYQNCVLQVTVWGDYGRLEGKKVFMGVAQIMLDQLDLSKMEIGWYKLFGTSALVNPAGLNLSRRSSLASLDSIKL
ncbi:hypothetical protein M8J75_000155 [Diaphorina citri]|nr:hypothetical protein M8J75_000155 [Diaphorina citri]